MRKIVILTGLLTMAVSGCFWSARPYGYYGYQTVAAPSTTYYSGGYYGGTYYRPGYYHQNAPFIQVSRPAVYVQPAYARPAYGGAVYVQPGYARPVLTAPSATVIVR